MVFVLFGAATWTGIAVNGPTTGGKKKGRKKVIDRLQDRVGQRGFGRIRIEKINAPFLAGGRHMRRLPRRDRAATDPAGCGGADVTNGGSFLMGANEKRDAVLVIFRSGLRNLR
jgi:hypothetical protein